MWDSNGCGFVRVNDSRLSSSGLEFRNPGVQSEVLLWTREVAVLFA